MRIAFAFIALAFTASASAQMSDDVWRRLHRITDVRELPREVFPEAHERAEVSQSIAEAAGSLIDFAADYTRDSRAATDVAELHRAWLRGSPESRGGLYKVSIYETRSGDSVFHPKEAQVLMVGEGSVPEAIYRAAHAQDQMAVLPAPPEGELTKIAYVYADREGKQQIVTGEALNEFGQFDDSYKNELSNRQVKDAAYRNRQEQLAAAEAMAKQKADDKAAAEYKKKQEEEKKNNEERKASEEKTDRERADSQRREAERHDAYDRMTSGGKNMVGMCAAGSECADQMESSRNRGHRACWGSACQSKGVNNLLSASDKILVGSWLGARRVGSGSNVRLVTVQSKSVLNAKNTGILKTTPYGLSIGDSAFQIPAVQSVH